jgi:branched-chain amino acid transport system ATP-binding protein
MEKILELKNIHVSFGGVHALNGVDAFIREGEMVSLMGPNGAGKSTLLKTMFGLAPISSGEIFWHGSQVRPVSYEMVERGISFVPQGKRVFPHLTVYENLEIGGITLKNKKDLPARIEEIMEIFPVLRHKRNRKSGELSGGEQQMVALARGIITDPKVLLLDEPSLGLAPKIVKEVFEKIKEINERHGTAIVVVEHNIKSLLEIVHRAYLLDKGRVVKEGEPKDLIGSGILEKVFLGKLE